LSGRRKSSDWQLPAAGHLNYCDLLEARLYNQRTLVLNGEIEEMGAGLLTNQFQTLAECGDEITLLITSYGGSVEAGGAIVRAIRHAQSRGCKVVGEVRGYAMSMASIVLQACDLRVATPEDIIMVHGFTGQSVGDVRNTEADAKLMKSFTEIYAKFYAERSTAEDDKFHDEEYWRKLLKDSMPRYYFGREAYEKGLIDEVTL
jgi:ATP-dependent Clp protease protease subunit